MPKGDKYLQPVLEFMTNNQDWMTVFQVWEKIEQPLDKRVIRSNLEKLVASGIVERRSEKQDYSHWGKPRSMDRILYRMKNEPQHNDS